MAKTTERLSLSATMAELKANGSERTRQTYRNAGLSGEMYGVSYAFLKKLHKRVKQDHELALALWDTRILDARILACWVAESEQTTIGLLNSWARDETEPHLSGELAAFVQDTPLAAGRMRQWIGMKSSYRRTLGWNVVARLALQPNRGPEDGGLDADHLTDLLAQIERDLQAAPNSVRHAMNSALIAIGCRPGWMKRALAVARAIGRVDIDFGSRSCTVKDATETIQKTVAHYRKQGKNPTDGTAGQRRRHC